MFDKLSENFKYKVNHGIYGIYKIDEVMPGYNYLLHVPQTSWCCDFHVDVQHLYLINKDGEIFKEIESFNDVNIIEVVHIRFNLEYDQVPIKILLR